MMPYFWAPVSVASFCYFPIKHEILKITTPLFIFLRNVSANKEGIVIFQILCALMSDPSRGCKDPISYTTTLLRNTDHFKMSFCAFGSIQPNKEDDKLL